MKKLTTAFVIFLAIILGIGIILSNKNRRIRDEVTENQLVTLNEINQLYLSGNTELASQKSTELRCNLMETANRATEQYWIFIPIAVAFLVAVFFYTYFRIIRPFNNLKAFAVQLSKGDFDTGLEYTRSDYFGDFTWAFDNMRHEIVKARKCEKETIENNKTVIASLSHDIKTPVASLRAYVEGLEANMDSTPEKRQHYLEVIMRKCDDIVRLTNDMTLHSLAGLDKLMVDCEPVDLCQLTRDIINELSPDNSNRKKVNLYTPDHPVNIYADSKRVAQIIENILNNSEKYAGTVVDITLFDDPDIRLEFRDYGPGIPNEDLPFIFEKFYRGHNAEDRPGSGLGLFIVKYLIEKQGGYVTITNSAPGLKTEVFFKRMPS